MAMDASFDLIDQEEEINFHKIRPLPVEHRPLKRVIDRLISPKSYLLTQAPSQEEFSQWRDEMLLEFSNLESTITRIQLLRHSNARECARYASEKQKIGVAATQIKDSTGILKGQLEEAREQLAVRKGWDEKAEEILKDKALKSREDQAGRLKKLEDEIRELEQESAEYKRTWVERRVQFGKIVEEGRQMLALIRDEKEEAERKEGMEETEDTGMGGVGAQSALGTPKVHATEVSTPLPSDANSLQVNNTSNINSRNGSGHLTPNRQTIHDNSEMLDITNNESETEEGEADES